MSLWVDGIWGCPNSGLSSDDLPTDLSSGGNWLSDDIVESTGHISW